MSVVRGDSSEVARVAAHVARSVAGREDEHFGIERSPSSVFAGTVLGCLQAGATFSLLEPGSPVDARFLGVSTVLDVDPAGLPDAPAPVVEGWFTLSSEDSVSVLSGLPGQVIAAVTSALAARATLVLDPPSLAEVTVLFTTGPALRGILDKPLSALRTVFVENNGDLLPHDVEALRRAAPSCRFVATYRTDSHGNPLAVYEVPRDWDTGEAPLRLPLGTLVTDRDVSLPQAVGEAGELRVDSVPTGDLVRRWPDGTLEFAGDPGPLETVAALRDLPDVRDAVLTERYGPDGEPVLVGYVAGPGQAPPRVAGVPVVVVDELPRTAAGDYDLEALPGPEAAVAHVGPRTPLEHELTEILCLLLKTDRIGVFDSFFELGGFSLLATQLASRIRENFGVELSLREIFESPTVDGLAQLIVRRELELTGADELEALLAEIERTDTGR
ncbi:phosphopantetheine-binding protein [Amycolatopsis sacchari]|uniref:phosphopantetheine-binding protein n=1 Tax=Amycolatopsis sacchari TaxID=115433 RepID=UPI003D741F39